MGDIYSKEKRSELMSKIRTKNTKPEVLLRKKLFETGLKGYRINYKAPGSPDIVYTRKKVAIFVDGCFWHGCPFCNSIPKTNNDFWINKIEQNKLRDKRVNSQLHELGWKVIRLWGHEIKKDLYNCVERIRKEIK